MTLSGFVHHGLQPDPRSAANRPTVMVPMVAPCLPFRDLFRRHYATIRRVCETHRRQGVALFVINRDGLAAAACLDAKTGDINTAVIGRHGAADVYVPDDGSLSLRHLALIIHPGRPGEDVRFRVVDLRTGLGFCDEHDRPLGSLETEGPLFVRCSEQSLLFLPTERDPLPWPDNPEDGWQCIPERIYLHEQPPVHERWQSPREDCSDRAAPRRPRRSLVWFVGAPEVAGPQLLESGELPVAEIVLHSPHQVDLLRVGWAALRRGILLGRYDRCDGNGLRSLETPFISRVHLLILEVGGQLYGIDLASANGVHTGTERVRSIALGGQQTLRLGQTWLQWRVFDWR